MDDPKTGQLMELVRNVKADRPGFELFVTLPTILRSYSEPYLKRLSGQVKPMTGWWMDFWRAALVECAG